MAKRISQVTGLEAQSWQTMSRSVLAIFRMIDTIVTLVVVIIVVVAGFGIAITLVLLVSEKRGTIGVLKAAGMTPQRIALGFLAAGLLIAGAGILLGELAGWLGVEILDRTPTGLRGYATFVESETFPMLKRWDIFALAAVAAFVVVLFASWFPARRAARLDPVAILRGE
jgi:ABC-type lipoprotein release transport system permease subunit